MAADSTYIELESPDGRRLAPARVIAVDFEANLALLGLAARFGGGPEIVHPPTNRIPLAVCGAHLEGLALHWQLADRGAVLRKKTTTAPSYRLFAMPAKETIPPRPALIHDAESGASIEVEVWELDPAAFGDFVSKIPEPLGIGKITLADGTQVPGFIAEPRAVQGAEEITSFGGWRAWLARPI
jgi:allophanate hydrolase